jgi:low temperature requirement protein LtrA
MSSTAPGRAPILRPVRREGSRVMPLELFFDLVFVLALTQCTALMADEPTWTGLGKGLLLLSVLWWAWVGYAWLTSVVEPEETLVRFTIFGAMAALLIVALSIPQAFGDWGLVFALSYAVVRLGQIGLFALASSDDPTLRRSLITGLTWSTTIGAGLLVGAAFADGPLQGALWLAAIAVDLAGPLLFGVEGWQLEPGHFAERHGLIIIIALGESIVAIGVGAEFGLDAGVVTAAVVGIAIAAALWWLYFDIVALVAERRLANAAPGREQNAVARDSFSYLHLPMVAGIVLVALGMKKSLEHVGDPLKLEPSVALLGGTALYLLAHVAFRWRNVHRFSVQRIACAIVLVALIPMAVEVPALVTLVVIAGLLAALIAYESVRFAELRERLRHQLGHEGGAASPGDAARGGH